MALYASGIVGDTDRLSTWGKFRIALARNGRDVPVRNLFNREWVTGLKAGADGSGWIRKPPFDRGSSGNFDVFAQADWQPCFFADTVTPPPPDPDYGEVVFLPTQYVRPTVSSELQAHLSGLVSTDGGNASMDAAFWGSSGAAVANPATVVNSVDGLVDF